MSSLVLLTVFTLYLLTLVIIGWFSFRRGVGSAEDYFMAGRSFGTLVLFMSLFGTNVTAFALVGMPGISYHAGIGVFGFFGAVAAFVTPLCCVFECSGANILKLINLIKYVNTLTPETR